MSRTPFTVEDAFAEALDSTGHVTRSVAHEVLSEEQDPPLPVRVLLGIGIWIGAGMVVGLLDLVEDLLWSGFVRAGLGFVALSAAAYFSRRRAWGDIRVHLTVVSAVLCEVLFVSTFPRDDVLFLLMFIAMQAALVVSLANSLSRFAGTMIASVSLWVLINEELQSLRDHSPLNELMVVGLLGVGVSLWLYRDAILRTRLASYQAPLGYAFVIAAAGAAALNLMLSFEPSFRWDEHRVYVAPLGLTGAVVLIGLFMLLAVRRQQQASPVSSKVAVIIVAVSAALAALTASAPEVSVALVLIALGHARRETGIYALGIALLGIALFALYHHVHTTLLWKSVWVTATGALLLVGWWTLARAFGDLGRRSGETPVDKGLSFAASVAVPGIAVVDRRLAQLFVGPRPVGAVAIALLFGLGVPFGLAAHKEELKRGGERVLLELAPSDPRSIMQGDYMTLTYAIENELRDRILDPQLDDEIDPMPVDGIVTLVLDDRGVARIASASEANDAGARVRLRYRVRGSWREIVHVAPSTFFFAEGTAASYASARYGEVAISGDGEAVLVGLRDANLNRL